MGALLTSGRPRSTARDAAAESFSEIVLASAGEFPYSTSSHGGVAQLGERLTGSQEVRGSIPLVSTRRGSVELFFYKNEFALVYRLGDA